MSISMISNNVKIHINIQNLANIIEFQIKFHQILPFHHARVGDSYNVVFFNGAECRRGRLFFGGCVRWGSGESERGTERGGRGEMRGGFYRDCCNSITVTRDARIGNVTNHET